MAETAILEFQFREILASATVSTFIIVSLVIAVLTYRKYLKNVQS